MTTQSLDQPFVASTALRSVNFFNGRLLTGDDLSREQATQAGRLQRLGSAVGDGIAWGFEVEEQPALSTTAKPVVTVFAGLAVSRSGAALRLDADLDVALFRDATAAPAGAEPGNLFADCQPAAPGTYTAGAGVYLLTVRPAESPEGLAQVNGLGNQDAPCNVALEAEALSFRLIRLSVEPSTLAEKELLRNRVAYACFGVDALAGVVADPFGPPATAWGLLDTLRTQTLSDDEVPLAVVGWSIDDGIQFVDLWSVRRRMTRRPAEGDWASLVSDRRRAEAEAIFLQFQAQIEDVLVETPPATEVASTRFERLPPVGLLPLGGAGLQGFDYSVFLSEVPTRGPAVLEPAHVPELLAGSLGFPPIEIEREELVWLYLVHDNLVPGPGGREPRRYVLFANGHTRYLADARFELSYWNFANYAEVG